MTESFGDIFLKAMRYEHWLRFYFLEDAADEKSSPMQASPKRELAIEELRANIAVPASWAARSHKEEPDLAAAILDALSGRMVSMEQSRDVIFRFVGEKTGVAPGSCEFECDIRALAQNAGFRRRMDCFHGWVQALANNEIDLKGNALPKGAAKEETPCSFSEWEEAFAFWFSMQKPFSLEEMEH